MQDNLRCYVVPAPQARPGYELDSASQKLQSREEQMTNPLLDIIARKSTLIAVVLGLIVTAAHWQTSPTATAGTQMTGAVPSGFRAGHVLVRFKGAQPQAVLDQLTNAFGAKAVGKIAEIGITHLQVPPQAGLALLEHLRQRPDVDFAEFDSKVQVFLQPDDPYFSASFASSHYGSVFQWGGQVVSAPEAWDISLGNL